MIPSILKHKQKEERTRNPWLLEKVENGLRATNIKESTITPTSNIEVQYFEYARIYGKGAFENALKVLDMFDELRNITPRTMGFIFGEHKYLYHNTGILRKNYVSGDESFFSKETLRNENVACYLNLVYSESEEKINTMIEELDNATSERSADSNDWKRIPHQDSEQ